MSLLVLNQTAGTVAELPLVPDRPVASRYRARDEAPFKTENARKAMGLVQTAQHAEQYRCKSDCLTVSYLHATFYGKEEPGSRILYICPNPAKTVDLNRFPPPPAVSYPDGWKCYLPDDLTD